MEMVKIINDDNAISCAHGYAWSIKSLKNDQIAEEEAGCEADDAADYCC